MQNAKLLVEQEAEEIHSKSKELEERCSLAEADAEHLKSRVQELESQEKEAQSLLVAGSAANEAELVSQNVIVTNTGASQTASAVVPYQGQNLFSVFSVFLPMMCLFH